MKKKLIRITSTLFPSFFARKAYEQLTHPQVHKLREHELTMLEKAHQEDLDYEGFTIRTYAWNAAGSKESILLIHGWEGQAGNFSDIIEALIQADYRVYAFDGPSHGMSSKGATSLFEFVALVGLMIRKYDVRNLITHSFGSVATAYVLSANQELEIDKFLMLTSPDKFSQRIDFIAEEVGVSPKVKQQLIDRIENELDMDVSKLNVSEWVKQVNVREALILHDENDGVLPIEQSLNVHQNWDVSRFESVTGTGHFRILRTPSVTKRIVTFFDEAT